MENQDRPAPIAVAAAYLAYVWTAFLFVGGFGAALGWRPGVFLMLAGLIGFVAGHLVMGVTEYHRIMSRPWPKVRPLDDDDDDDDW
jgi:high-affinity Fe2+/Pb2+ permease